MTDATGFDSLALYEALDRRRLELELDWPQVCAAVGLSDSTDTRLRHGAHPTVEALVRLLLWLGDTDVRAYIRHDVGG